MVQNILNKPIVLQLNGNWMPVGIKSVKEAMISMMSEGDESNSLALDVSYERGEDGEFDFSSPTYMNPVKWEEWITLPIREYDFVIHTVKLEIRVPTVLVATNYRHIPVREPAPTKHNIFVRDNGICQYTGKKLNRTQGNIDHIIPRSRGGKNTWENMVWCDKKINLKKGNRLPHEVGLRLSKTPKSPGIKPIITDFKEAKHVTWIPFIQV